MKARFLAVLAALSLAASANAGTSVGVTVQVGDNAPAPVIVAEPHVVLVPNTSVWVLKSDSDYDTFRYGDRWYVCRDGHWYRAKHWKGPFFGVRERQNWEISMQHQRPLRWRRAASKATCPKIYS